MQLNLHEVLRLTQAASRKWHDLGLLLGISESTLETIEKDHHDAQSSFREVISVWLSAPSASWEVLIEALRNPSLELSVIVHQIQLELEPGMFSVSMGCLATMIILTDQNLQILYGSPKPTFQVEY